MQYGCGLSAPDGWVNFDSSPTLIIQKLPLLGVILKKYLNITFPGNVRYGDIVKGLPGVDKDSCKGVYCSHVLEHLSLFDCRKALSNSYQILAPNGIFRLVVPDLQKAITDYSQNKSDQASIHFMKSTLLGKEKRTRNISGLIYDFFSNKHHLWMWDYLSLRKELEDVGFSDIRKCNPGDSPDKKFLQVENPARYINSIGIECIK